MGKLFHGFNESMIISRRVKDELDDAYSGLVFVQRTFRLGGGDASEHSFFV